MSPVVVGEQRSAHETLVTQRPATSFSAMPAVSNRVHPVGH